jgi:hypothetical protein
MAIVQDEAVAWRTVRPTLIVYREVSRGDGALRSKVWLAAGVRSGNGPAISPQTGERQIVQSVPVQAVRRSASSGALDGGQRQVCRASARAIGSGAAVDRVVSCAMLLDSSTETFGNHFPFGFVSICYIVLGRITVSKLC